MKSFLPAMLILLSFCSSTAIKCDIECSTKCIEASSWCTIIPPLAKFCADFRDLCTSTCTSICDCKENCTKDCTREIEPKCVQILGDLDVVCSDLCEEVICPAKCVVVNLKSTFSGFKNIIKDFLKTNTIIKYITDSVTKFVNQLITNFSVSGWLPDLKGLVPDLTKQISESVNPITGTQNIILNATKALTSVKNAFMGK